MTAPLFDQAALALRRDRARRRGPRLFLAERTVEDIAERLGFVERRFGRGVLMGCPDPRLGDAFAEFADQLILVPDLDALAGFPPGSLDLLIILGQLDTVDELPAVLQVLHFQLAASGLLIGAFAGNNSLPRLRSAMLAADRADGRGVAPRMHPQIEASAFAGLLQDAGFTLPVVDIDRVSLRYRNFNDLVADLRGMAATNILSGRSSRPVLRRGREAAMTDFAAAGTDGATVETVEIVHYAAWAGGAKQP